MCHDVIEEHWFVFNTIGISAEYHTSVHIPFDMKNSQVVLCFVSIPSFASNMFLSHFLAISQPELIVNLYCCSAFEEVFGFCPH